ncbi:hypothetical protein RB195_014149 [Necator americanus]|uniref:Endonuclease/exonuclease/phosphatase domain-containing protein n=1 Tax=Necator americanus TaxID=51031 RepID=A0ABR1DYU5_NECAM
MRQLSILVYKKNVYLVLHFPFPGAHLGQIPAVEKIEQSRVSEIAEKHGIFGNNRFVTLNCCTLPSEFEQGALPRLLRYLDIFDISVQETCIEDRPVVTRSCRGMRNDQQEFGSAICAFVRLRNNRRCKLWIVGAHTTTRTSKENLNDNLYDENFALMSKILSQYVVIVGIDANANMGLEQQSEMLGKWYYPVKHTSDSDYHLADLCEQASLVTFSRFRRNHRLHHLRWQWSTLFMPEEKKMRTLKLQLNYPLKRNIPQPDIRKSRADRDGVFDSNHCPVLRSFRISFTKKDRRADRENEWTLRPKEFEKAWEYKHPKKAYASLKQYSSKMKRRSPILKTANGVGVGEAILPISKDHFSTLLNLQALSTLELEHVQRPTSTSPHRGRLPNAHGADGVPGKFVRPFDDMHQRASAAVRIPAGCTTSFEMVTGVRQGTVGGPSLFNFAIDNVMERTVDQCTADVILTIRTHDLEYMMGMNVE